MDLKNFDRSLTEFPHQIKHNLRYSDTDRQGHVNNSVFATFVEMGRVDILYKILDVINSADSSYVIANLEISYIKELNWPNDITIATGISKVGSSSVIFMHGIFRGDGTCVAKAKSVCVHFCEKQRKSTPLTDDFRAKLKEFEFSNL